MNKVGNKEIIFCFSLITLYLVLALVLIIKSSTYKSSIQVEETTANSSMFAGLGLLMNQNELVESMDFKSKNSIKHILECMKDQNNLEYLGVNFDKIRFDTFDYFENSDPRLGPIKILYNIFVMMRINENEKSKKLDRPKTKEDICKFFLNASFFVRTHDKVTRHFCLSNKNMNSITMDDKFEKIEVDLLKTFSTNKCFNIPKTVFFVIYPDVTQYKDGVFELEKDHKLIITDGKKTYNYDLASTVTLKSVESKDIEHLLFVKDEGEWVMYENGRENDIVESTTTPVILLYKQEKSD